MAARRHIFYSVIAMFELALLILVCAAATYLWRGLGVLLSGKVRADGEIFTWVGCVAYAMIAALIARMIFLPAGSLAATSLAERLAAITLALLAYYIGRKNLLLGILAGFTAMCASGWLQNEGFF